MELGMNLANGNQCVSFLERKWVMMNSYICRELLFPCEVSKSLQPIFTNTLKTEIVGRRRMIFGPKRASYGRVNSMVKEESGGGRSVDEANEFEFKPSFDEYLKAMESVRTGRGRKHEQELGRLGPKSSLPKKNGTLRTAKRSEMYEKKKKLTEDNADLGRDKSSTIEEDWLRHGDVEEKRLGVDNERTLEIMEWSEEDTNEEQGGSLSSNGVYEKLQDNSKRAEEGLDQRLSWRKVRMSKAQKGAKYEVDDSEFEVERAAFRNFGDADDVVVKPPVSRVEMEQRIQKLAQGLNGAEIDMPEWMFAKMIRSAKIRFSDHSIMRVIQLLGKLGNWRRVLQVIEWLQKQERFKSHKLRHIYTAALDVLGKARRPVEALNVFNSMQQQISTYPDLVAYHSIAVTLGQAGHLKELLDVIEIMRAPPKKKFEASTIMEWDPRLEPDIFVYNAVLNACVNRKQCEGAFWVLQQLNQQGQTPSSATYGLVMEVMFACGKYNLVQEFFREAQKSGTPNALTYRVLVNSLWKEGKTDEAVLAVEEMEGRGIVGSAALYYDLARCLCTAGRCQEALEQIERICKVASKPLVVTYTGLIQACMDSGNIQDGVSIFQQMEQHCSPNLVTCNIMLKAYLGNNMFEDAKKLLFKMLDDGSHISNRSDYRVRVVPDAYSFNTMLDACVAEKRWEDLEFVYKKMLSHGFHFNLKRHLHVVLEASRVGKRELLETTWNQFVQSGCSLPSALVKERFITMLEKDDTSGALSAIISPLTSESLSSLTKKAWLKLFKENAQRFRRDTLARLTREIRVHMASTALPALGLQNLVASCDEFISTGW
ncbi:pentatricopeptide repeat-containing protein At1g30610, chloroplastic [Punica granatum]|uniref:Pentatricopeptide repeat-containing protein At1g30610, chloroplastic n=1 Tax=Punica granatum TaxID=22663 RepID=A0A6P8EHB4_PUNGR|nr:pentatricopeptide repeat-containing protein At1g30610, chloroplastic [Punica granatum]XP_031404822.1 pentatricopeptide repeat-containing protein At1g30610, chloroplastic [Punica granatum]